MKHILKTTLTCLSAAFISSIASAQFGVEDKTGDFAVTSSAADPGAGSSIHIDFIGEFDAATINGLGVHIASDRISAAANNAAGFNSIDLPVGPVRAYLIHYNPFDDGVTTGVGSGVIDFAGEVLGFSGDHSDLHTLDSALGSAGFGFSGVNGRGSGFNVGKDGFSASADMFSITGDGSVFDIEQFTVLSPFVDQLYVFTAIPEPATVVGVLIALGLVGFVTFRRRSKFLAEANAA